MHTGGSISITIEIHVPYERAEGEDWPFGTPGLILSGDAARKACEGIFETMASRIEGQRRWDRERETSQISVIVRPYEVAR